MYSRASNLLAQWFSTRYAFCLPGNIQQYLETFLVVTTEKGAATGISWLEARDAHQHPAMPRKAPHQNYLVQNVNRAEVEQPASGREQAAVATACVTMGCVAMARVHELVLLPGGARAPLSGSDEPLVGTTHSLSCRLPHTTSLAKLFLVLVPEGTASVPRDLGTAEMCSPHDQMLREKKIEKNRKKNCLGGKY